MHELPSRHGPERRMTPAPGKTDKRVVVVHEPQDPSNLDIIRTTQSKLDMFGFLLGEDTKKHLRHVVFSAFERIVDDKEKAEAEAILFSHSSVKAGSTEKPSRES